MAFINLFEIVDILIMTAALGYIFMRIFRPARSVDPVDYYLKKKSDRWKAFWFAAAVVAPGIVLHELGHKFVAIAFGAHAIFFAGCSSQAILGNVPLFNFSCILLIGAVILSFFNFPVLLFVPGFVQHTSTGPLPSAIIAFSGPAINGLLWIVARLGLKYQWFPRKYNLPLAIAGRINGFLFIFNMLPIPPFDGFWVLEGLAKGLLGV